jgi:hypothetical protein
MTTTASHVSRCFLFTQPLAAPLDTDHRRISCQAQVSKMCSPTPEEAPCDTRRRWRRQHSRWRAEVLGEPASDLLILIGKDDTWTPAPDCLKYVELHSRCPHAPTIKVYPRAVHAFDGAYRVGLVEHGHLQGVNPEARADSYEIAPSLRGGKGLGASRHE